MFDRIWVPIDRFLGRRIQTQQNLYQAMARRDLRSLALWRHGQSWLFRKQQYWTSEGRIPRLRVRRLQQQTHLLIVVRIYGCSALPRQLHGSACPLYRYGIGRRSTVPSADFLGRSSIPHSKVLVYCWLQLQIGLSQTRNDAPNALNARAPND